MSSQAVIISRLNITGVTSGPSGGAADEDKLVKLNASGQIDSSFFAVAATDHGALLGLADDDHSQYHNNTRGDLRYYTQALLSSTANGEGASLVAVEDAGGYFSGSTVEAALQELGAGALVPDHGALSGLADDDHSQYHNDTRGDLRYYTQTLLGGTIAGQGASLIGVEDAAANFVGTDVEAVLAEIYAAIGGVADHGGLTGLLDDDHTQYLNQGRGDARYYTQTLLGSTSSGQGASLIGIFDTGGYYTATTVEGALQELGTYNDHGALSGLADDDHTQYLDNTRGDARYRTQTILASTNVGEGASLVGIRDTGGYFTSDHVEGALQELGLSVGGVSDHGGLSGLADDDHTQYLDNARGDVRYFRQSLLDSNDNSEGASLIGIEDVGGYYTGTEVEAALQEAGLALASIDHGAIAGLSDDDHSQYHNDTRGDIRYYTKVLLGSNSNAEGASLIGIEDTGGYFTGTEVETALQELGALDHGTIGGLSDDDHSQYHNDTRGDIRYYTKTLLGSNSNAEGASLVGIEDTGGYFTGTEVETALQELGALDHGTIGGLSDDDHSQYHNDTRGDIRYYTKTLIGSTSNAEGASLVGIEDTGGYFTGTEVEAALQELGENNTSVFTATGGKEVRTYSEATVSLSGATSTCEVNVPSGCKITGVQYNTETAVTSGDGATSLDIAFSGGSSTSLWTGQAFAQNTKASKMIADEHPTSEVDIVITPDSNTFSGGSLRFVVYYTILTDLDDV